MPEKIMLESDGASHKSLATVVMEKEDEEAFKQFCDLGISRRTILFVGGVLFLGTSYAFAMSLIAPKSWYLLSIVAALGFLVRTPMAVMIMCYSMKVVGDSPEIYRKQVTPWLPMAMNLVSFLTSFTLGLFLIARVVNGKCESYDQLHIWSCNSEFDANALPQELVVLLMLLPLLYSVAFNTIQTNYIMIAWFIGVASITIAIAVGGATQSIPALLIYTPVSFTVLIEIHRQKAVLFGVMKNQKLLLEANKRLSEDSQNELRFMIANMAHDLKTPLSAFMNGVETLSSLVNELDDGHCLRRSLKENLSNLNTVNNFMTMTVNRCIDYMKASKGIKLEPRLETINLQEVLSMPLNCMRDLQSRVAIIQKPIPSSVCSHIITDLQWFQENLFCLISNAVKYSSHGHITVSVSLTTDAHPQIAAAELKRRTSSRSQSVESDSGTFSGHPPAERYSFLDRMIRSSPKQFKDTTDVELGHGGGLGSGSSINSLYRSSVRSSPRVFQGLMKTKSMKIYATEEASLTYTDAPHVEDMLLVEVEDTGIGLSDEVKQTLFTPFKQAQRRAGGTGLGLYSLAKRVDALGGYYGVSNRRDGEQGSIFWFAVPYRPDASPFNSRASIMRASLIARSLPETVKETSETDDTSFRLADTQTIVRPTTALMQTTAEIPPPGKLRVLLVDDSPTILKMTSNLLRRHGHVVDQEENGADALVRLEKTRSGPQSTPPYDVMLIDLNMPVMDGLEATKRLRAIERQINSSSKNGVTYHQKVFAFSANSDNATMQEAMEAGADDFITKPFSILTFNEKIEKWDIRTILEDLRISTMV